MCVCIIYCVYKLVIKNYQYSFADSSISKPTTFRSEDGDECRLLAGNSEIGRSSPPSLS